MVSEIDILISKYIEKHLSEIIANSIMRKITDSLIDSGYSFENAIQMYYPLHKTLQDFFGKKTDHILQKVLSQIFEKKKNFLIIKNSDFIDFILYTYGDVYKKSILQMTVNRPHSIKEMITKTCVPQSSGYKLIHSLIDQGFLSVINNKKRNIDGNIVLHYVATIHFLHILIQNSSIKIYIHFNKDAMKKSNFLKLL